MNKIHKFVFSNVRIASFVLVGIVFAISSALMNSSSSSAVTTEVTGITVMNSSGAVSGATVTVTYLGYAGYSYNVITNGAGYADLYTPNPNKDITGNVIPPYAPTVLWEIKITPPAGSTDVVEYWDSAYTSATAQGVYLMPSAPTVVATIGPAPAPPAPAPAPPAPAPPAPPPAPVPAPAPAPANRITPYQPSISVLTQDGVVASPTPTPTPTSTPTPTRSHTPTLSPSDANVIAKDIQAEVASISFQLDPAVFMESFSQEPSVFSSVRKPGTFQQEFSKFCAAGALATVLAILVALPSALLERVISNEHGRIAGFFRVFFPAPGTKKKLNAETKVGRKGFGETLFGNVKGWLVVPVVFLGSVISSFADPDFGLNGKSLRILILMVLTFLLVNVLGTSIVWLLTRGHSNLKRPKVLARPAYLLLILISVVIARTMGIEPSLVIGSVLAIDYGVRISQLGSVKADFIGTGYVLFLGLTSWAVYSMVSATQLASPVERVWIEDVTSILCVQALSSLPLLLLPFAFLSGHNIFEWKKWVWIVYYALILCVYAFILLPLDLSWQTVSVPVGVWITIFVSYALLAVGVWAFFEGLKLRKPRNLS